MCIVPVRCLVHRPERLHLYLPAHEGITFDMSIVGGIRFDNAVVRLDYRHCEEDFLPFFPVMQDARRVSDRVEKMICVRPWCFNPKPLTVLREDLRRGCAADWNQEVERALGSAAPWTAGRMLYGAGPPEAESLARFVGACLPQGDRGPLGPGAFR